MKFLKGLLLSLLNFLLFCSIIALGFAYMMNQTIMDPNFVNRQIDKLDIAAAVSSVISVPKTPSDAQTFIDSNTLNNSIAAAIKSSEPELKDELNKAILGAYDYFLGKSNYLTIDISLSSVKKNLKSTLWSNFQKSPPSQISGVPYSQIPPAQVEQVFNQYFDQFTQNIPSSFTLDTNKLNPATLKTIQDVKQYIGYYDIGWKLTIPLILVLAIAIVFLENNLRGSLRSLGINLFLFGALGVVSDFLLNRYATPSTVIPGLPAALSTWLNGFLNDVFAPLNVFSIAVASIGAVLFIVSFFIKKKETA